MDRTSTIIRNTLETNIALTLNLDGTGRSDVNTGIGFFDHMLISFSKHGFFDLTVEVDGDLEVDCHHTIEDTGIALGEAIADAIGDKKGIQRFGSEIVPMDEALILTSLDLSGRPYLGFEAGFSSERVGGFDTQMVKEFFYAVSYSSKMNLHIREFAGSNDHHVIEAMFKSFGRALDKACTYDPRIDGVLSTKGTL